MKKIHPSALRCTPNFISFRCALEERQLRKQIKLTQEQLDTVQPTKEPSEPEASDNESDASKNHGQETDLLANIQ
ncbi:hypothetical protein KQX54_008627, partial [Cotesia glomerata]